MWLRAVGLSHFFILDFAVQRVDAQEEVSADAGHEQSGPESRPTLRDNLKELENDTDCHKKQEQGHFRVITLQWTD